MIGKAGLKPFDRMFPSRPLYSSSANAGINFLSYGYTLKRSLYLSEKRGIFSLYSEKETYLCIW